MKISGLTFVRNGFKLCYPFKQSIQSILPLVDEFVIAIGNNDQDDDTLEQIKSIASSKIEIIHTTWDLKKYKKGHEFAHQTDIAKEACSGDWLFYLQCDEVVHENDLDSIKKECEKYLDDSSIEGFLFKYYHFWGDYEHYHTSHGWYPKEIRIIRNNEKIHSWRDAQSFRYFSEFNGDYGTKEGNRKIRVKLLDAHIYHYGYVRPPVHMQIKSSRFHEAYLGKNGSETANSSIELFDYGTLNKIPRFSGSHPSVMNDRINQFDWAHQLQYSSKMTRKARYCHEKLKYKLRSFLENRFLNGRTIGGFKNYELIK